MRALRLTIIAILAVRGLCAHADGLVSCALSGPDSIGMYVTRSGATGSYAGGKRSPNSQFSVRGCAPTPTTRYLIVGFGANEMSTSQGAVSQHYFGLNTDDRCRIENSPFDERVRFSDRRNYYERKTRFLKTCVLIDVKDPVSGSLTYPESQPGCEITRVAVNQVRMRGTYCSFDIRELSHFDFDLKMDPRCADRAFLGENGLEPMDVPSQFKFFSAGDPDGSAGDRRDIGEVGLRASIDPNPKVQPTSEDQDGEVPLWPSSWAADVHAGKTSATVTDGGRAAQVSVSFLAHNRAPARCAANGECESPAEYSLPFNGEVTLYALGQRGREFLGSTSFGAVLLPRWQGEVAIEPDQFTLQAPLELGREYEWEAVFADPFEDYVVFMTRLAQSIGEIPPIAVGGGVQPLRTLPKLRPYKALGTLPSLPGVAASNRGGFDPTQTMQDALRDFQALGNTAIWPVFYDWICDDSSPRCDRPGKVASKTKLVSRFLVTGKSADGEYQLAPVSARRESPILGDYVKLSSEIPRIVCE